MKKLSISCNMQKKYQKLLQNNRICTKTQSEGIFRNLKSPLPTSQITRNRERYFI